MVPDTKPEAQEQSVRKHLNHITQRWHELDESVLLEMVFLTAEDKARVRQVMHYTPDENGLEMAVSDALSWNKMGVNVYATVNPVSATNRPEPHKRAKAEHIVASFFHWADADDAQAAENIRNFVGPKCTFFVLTGTQPSHRPHVYWELDEPTRNFPAWERTQKAIAHTLKTDSSVTDPPRIMRLAGTVNWPKPQKIAKGYIPEAVTITIHSEDDRPAVSSERMARAFKYETPSLSSQSAVGLHIDTGEMPSLDRERTAIKAMTGDEWNTNVFKLVGSYVRKGMSDAEILALVEPLTTSGYTVADTREEVQAMIDRTRANPAFEGAGQDEQPEPVKPTPEAIADFRIDSSDEFLADLEPLEYLIEGVLPRGVVYSLTGHAGHGKTTLALQFALSVATGEEFAGRECAQGSVLILAGENPYNVKYQYAAALAARGIKSADIHFVQGRFSIDQWSEVLRTKMAQMPNLKLVIVDSLQAFFEGDNDNDNSQMVTMAHKIRAIGSVDARPAMLIIAHPAGKTPQKENLVPRGGGAFLNEIDGNLTIWSQDASQQTLHHSQKFRGAGFDPLEFVMQVHEFDHLTDIKGTPLKLPVSRPEMSIERANREVQTNTLLTRYLELVEQKRAPSEREAATLWGVSRRRVRSVIETAKEEKLIKRYARTYAITDGGKAFLEDQNAGE